jgi:hypothetical protein
MAGLPNRSMEYGPPSGAVSSVFIAAIEKGQLPVVLIAMLLGIMLIRMPAEDVSLLTFRLLDFLAKWHILGWALEAITLILWFMHAKIQRGMITSEFDRVTKERDYYQALAGVKVKSSSSESDSDPRMENRA